MWQTVIVLIIVVAVVLFLARKATRVARGQDGLCCDTCSGCASNHTRQQGMTSNQQPESCPNPVHDRD